MFLFRKYSKKKELLNMNGDITSISNIMLSSGHIEVLWFVNP